VNTNYFVETHVPIEIRNFDVIRCWKPRNGSRFRVVMEKNGEIYRFPGKTEAPEVHKAINELCIELDREAYRDLQTT
jgi:hypothetical protein